MKMTTGRALASLLLGVTLCGSGSFAGEDPFVWIKMPLLTPEQAKAGISPGGEGGQWPRGPIAVSPADRDFLLLPIDVGGVYRSLDGGKHWEVAMVGWDARGANGFAIDPQNSSRAIGIAANSMNWDNNWGPSPHGLYFSTDKAASWKHVLALPGGFGGTVAYDPNSFDAAKGFCTRAYYLSEISGMFKTDDGGATWSRLKSAPDPGTHPKQDWSLGVSVHANLAVDAKSGAIFLGGSKGLFVSADHGQNWSQLRDAPVFSVAISPTGTLFISGADTISASKDNGKSWLPIACGGLDTRDGKHIQSLAISPADPLRMRCWTSGKFFNWPRYFSWDGGATWTVIKHDRGGAILPSNGREGYATWSPRDPNVAWSIGGDWVVKSTDGGKTFNGSNNGYNGIMAGGLFNFSTHDPKTVYIGFQDYNGAFTTDGGQTWNYRDVSGKGWGGHQYGAFALNAQVMWSGDPEDAKVGFIARFRSADAGLTWQAMDACDGVFIGDAKSCALYGKKGNDLVRSTDHGVTWEKIAGIDGGFSDVATDSISGRIYLASQGRLKICVEGKISPVETPADQYGNVAVQVAPDERSHRTIRRPLQHGIEKAIFPLHDESRRHGDFPVVTENVDEIAREHSARVHEALAFEVHDLR